ESGTVGVFELKEKLEILQQQTRCVWVNFVLKQIATRLFFFGYREFFEKYTDEKHKFLFYK
ncbi:hypothetical protein BgiMline_009407, partial [Biomphalaria glabrata]